MRLKESYFVNLPQYANKVMEFAMGVLSEKLKKRVIVCISNKFLSIFRQCRLVCVYFVLSLSLYLYNPMSSTHYQYDISASPPFNLCIFLSFSFKIDLWL